MGEKHFDYEEFGAQLAFERDYPMHAKEEILQKESNETPLTPSVKANIQDSLQFLLEINIQIELLQQNKISKKEFSTYLIGRKEQWGYISDPKFILRLVDDVKLL